MLRLILLFLLALALPARAEMPSAPPLHPSPAFVPTGPLHAKGALVWLHGSYDTEEEPNPPAEPAWVGRVARAGYDIWRFDRAPGQDPLVPGGESLVRGLEGLRAAGYRKLIVAGHSRGAFIALAALAHPGLVAAIAAISPAAHGTRPERGAQAMQDFSDRMTAAKGPMRFAFVQLADDPFDLDPDGRAVAVRAMARRTGIQRLLIDRPPAPTGHLGVYDPAFDRIFGERLARFLTGG